MCIITLSLIMFLIEWTPLCLEVKHVKVKVFQHEMNNPRLDVSLRVGKGTVLSIVTLQDEVGELSAILRLVFLNVVQPLDPVMG